MSEKLSNLERAVLAVLQDNKKGALNAVRVWSRIAQNNRIDKDAVYKALLSLVQKKRALQVSKGNFMFLHAATTTQGLITFTKNRDAWVIPSEKSTDDGDIFVPEEFTGSALPGDMVEVEIFGGKKKNTGRVMGVIERSNKPIVGELDVFDGQAFLLPDKKAFPFDIKLSHNIPNDKNGQKASVLVQDFPSNSRYPTGKVLEYLGKAGTNDAEMHSIVAEFGFRIAFSDAVIAETETFPNELTEGISYSDRKDLRKILTFTIDPADAKDFDDAISYEKLPNGNLSIGVHIADVSHYVTQDSALDQEALLRGTSVYLADRTIPMLPEKLSNNLCSLRPNEDRLAFSAVFEVDVQGNVLNRWFGKTVIHSVRRFSYEEAQERIVSGAGDLAAELQLLNTLAKKYTAARFASGAMSFESDEVRFEMDDKGKPLRVLLKKRFDAHRLIEEFMLLANKEVAKFVKEKQKPELPFIYRSHDSPSQEKLMDLARFCQMFGYKLDYSNDQRLRTSLNQILTSVQGKPEEDIITQSAIRSMARAVYTSERSDHFGLAFTHYSHFTSPIRRYPDLLAHRILYRYLQDEPAGYTQGMIESISKQSSAAEQKATEAERASTKYKMAEYLQQHIGQVFEAVISGVTEWGIFAEIIENHCEGMIRISDIRGDRWVYFEKEKKVKGQRSRKTFALGDVISVKVKSANPAARTIDFLLADY